jgi:hypothetical protein
MQNTVKIELTHNDLCEMHIALIVRKCQLQNDVDTYANKQGAEVLTRIAIRQLERISPIVYQLGCYVRESMQTETQGA